MKNKTLIYSLLSLLASGTLIGSLVVNRSLLAQNSHHSQGMGMMRNQQQIDQHFLQMMIPHHEGAVDMANLALTKAKHPELKNLAQAIKIDQTQEIQKMKSWYKSWYGSEVPATSTTEMPMSCDYGMGSMNMNMDLNALKKAPNFDEAFIAEMIPHHQMAVMMAAMILSSPHAELRNLGKAIIQNQSTEIEEMLQWQKAWTQ